MNSANSYNGNGLIVRSRSKVWAGLTQDFPLPGSLSPADEISLAFGIYIKLLDPPAITVGVFGKFRVSFTDGSKAYFGFDKYTITPGTNAEWHHVSGTKTFNVSIIWECQKIWTK